MKFSDFLSKFALLGLAYSAACPFEDLRRSGLLSAEDAARFDAIKRDPKAADVLLKAHRRDTNAAAAPRSSSDLIGPLLNGLLDLPLGGGLCKICHTEYKDLLLTVPSVWRITTSDRRVV